MTRAVDVFLPSRAPWHASCPLAIASQTTATAQAASASVTCASTTRGRSAATAPMVSYTAINPVRLVDTRSNIGGLPDPSTAAARFVSSLGADIPRIGAGGRAVDDRRVARGRLLHGLSVRGRTPTDVEPELACRRSPHRTWWSRSPTRTVRSASSVMAGPHLIIDLAAGGPMVPTGCASIEPERVYDTRGPGFTPLGRPSRCAKSSFRRATMRRQCDGRCDQPHCDQLHSWRAT